MKGGEKRDGKGRTKVERGSGKSEQVVRIDFVALLKTAVPDLSPLGEKKSLLS